MQNKYKTREHGFSHHNSFCIEQNGKMHEKTMTILWSDEIIMPSTENGGLAR